MEKGPFIVSQKNRENIGISLIFSLLNLWTDGGDRNVVKQCIFPFFINELTKMS